MQIQRVLILGQRERPAERAPIAAELPKTHITCVCGPKVCRPGIADLAATTHPHSHPNRRMERNKMTPPNRETTNRKALSDISCSACPSEPRMRPALASTESRTSCPTASWLDSLSRTSTHRKHRPALARPYRARAPPCASQSHCLMVLRYATVPTCAPQMGFVATGCVLESVPLNVFAVCPLIWPGCAP